MKVIIQMMGGMGNQMFQYALALALMEKGIQVSFDMSWFNGLQPRPYMLGIFPDIRIKKFSGKATNGHIWVCRLRKKLASLSGQRIWENRGIPYDENIETIKSGVLTGYFTNERYFRNVSDIVRKEFRFPKGEEKLESLIRKIETENYVSLHIRRGDYLELKDIYGGICNEEYYLKAMEYFLEKDKGTRFLVISNDIQWIKENMGIPNAKYVTATLFDQYQDWYDMCIMSHCRNNIIANSTFSWWGAWLNGHEDKIVICPEKWDNKNKKTGPACERWIVI